jgi:hypothetical protein
VQKHANYPIAIALQKSNISVSRPKGLRKREFEKDYFSHSIAACWKLPRCEWRDAGDMFFKKPLFFSLFFKTCLPRFLHFSLNAFACAILGWLHRHYSIAPSFPARCIAKRQAGGCTS